MRFITTIILALIVSQPALATMYKWVDERGITHYGDTLPPQYAGQGTSEMSKQGQVIRKTARSLTPEQRKAKEEAAAIEKAEAQKDLEQRRKDRALLNSYSTEDEIVRARDRNMQLMDVAIQGTQTRIKSTQIKLDTMRKQRENIAHAKRPVPQGLVEDIQETELTLTQLNDFISQKQQEKEAIRAKFDEERLRFRGLRLAGEQSPKP